jgi:hypothetical protein
MPSTIDQPSLWTAVEPEPLSADTVRELFKKLHSNPWHQFSEAESALLATALANKMDDASDT